MIKNIIFDLDNTIIRNKKEDILKYREALHNSNFDESDSMKIYNALGDYENSLSEDNRYLSKENAVEFLNNFLDRNYNVTLINEINEVIGKYWTTPLLPKSTLKYLESKYNLYVFTNWFEDCQIKRLDNAGYLKYFKKVFGSDNFGSKPFTESFNEVLNFIGASPSECIMIGDSKPHDILGANNAGMSAILFDYNDQRDRKDIYAPNYSVITDLKELENIL